MIIKKQTFTPLTDAQPDYTEGWGQTQWSATAWKMQMKFLMC